MVKTSESQKEISGLIGELLRPKECWGLGWDWAIMIQATGQESNIFIQNIFGLNFY